MTLLANLPNGSLTITASDIYAVGKALPKVRDVGEMPVPGKRATKAAVGKRTQRNAGNALILKRAREKAGLELDDVAAKVTKPAGHPEGNPDYLRQFGDKAIPGSLREWVEAYQQTDYFLTLADETRRMRKPLFDEMMAMLHPKEQRPWGECEVMLMEREHVRTIQAAIHEKG